jgi:hypothetical protein
MHATLSLMVPSGSRIDVEQAYGTNSIATFYFRKSNVTGYSTELSSDGIFATNPGVCP